MAELKPFTRGYYPWKYLPSRAAAAAAIFMLLSYLLPTIQYPSRPESSSSSSNLRTTLLSLAGIESQPICLSLESDDSALGKVKHISRNSMYFLTGLIGNVKLPLDNDLHLMVGIGIDEWGAGFESVETA